MGVVPIWVGGSGAVILLQAPEALELAVALPCS